MSAVAAHSGVRARLASRAALPWIVLAAIFAGSVAANRAFLSPGTLRLQLVQASMIGIVGIGETLAILLGQIDLSIPWTLTLSAILSTSLYAAHPIAAVPVAVVLALGTAVGLLNALGVAVLRVHSLIWTLSVNLLLQGLTLVWTDAGATAPGVPPLAHALALGEVAGLPAAALLWAALAAAAILALRRFPFGRRVYATGSNPLAALMSGVPIGRITTIAYVASGIGAALVGLMLSGYSSQAYLGMGNDYLLPPVAAAVIGGNRLAGGEGGVGGTIAGCLSVVLLEATLVGLDVSEGQREIVFGVVLLALVLVFARRRD